MSTVDWWIPLVLGWALGLIGNFLIESYRSTRNQETLSRALKAEITTLYASIIDYQVQLEVNWEVYLRNMVQIHAFAPPRTVYRANVGQINILPESCMVDLIEFYQLLDQVEMVRAKRLEAKTLPEYQTLLNFEAAMLESARLRARKLLPALSLVHGESISERELDAMEAEFRDKCLSAMMALKVRLKSADGDGPASST